MYAGSTFNHQSGNVFGVHQKIDKAAYKVLIEVKGVTGFPNIQEILHFEGKNGPDGIKRKAPSRDEPWHFFDPNDQDDTALFEHIENHQHNLRQAVTQGNRQRAAFEAAWLAHAVVDGLTPAHHFPLEEFLEKARGEGLETRDSIRKKILLPGESKRERLRNNWYFWGAKGIMTTHFLFELGIAGAITPYPKVPPVDPAHREYIKKNGYAVYYRRAAHAITELGMYEEFSKKGWTTKLGRQTKGTLIPTITHAVALAWLDAIS
jgi:hypothetical protein